jgi:hypothetical protein
MEPDKKERTDGESGRQEAHSLPKKTYKKPELTKFGEVEEFTGNGVS